MSSKLYAVLSWDTAETHIHGPFGSEEIARDYVNDREEIVNAVVFELSNAQSLKTEE